MSSIVIGVTLGDPGGIGPELAARVADDPPAGVSPLLFGTEAALEQGAVRAGIDAAALADRLRPCPGPSDVPVGEPSRAAGECALEAIRTAVECAQRREIAALVTAPICKASFALAGVDHPGHTELLAKLCGADRVGMVFVAQGLRVALLTTHISVAEVPERVSKGSVLGCIRLLHGALESEFGERDVPIRVAGLNPHLGERGLFGREEIDSIAPAVEAARNQGIQASGPDRIEEVLAPSGVGTPLRGVVALYHDQALAPLKMIHGLDMVNVTVGLPIVRTSPDHGTAFELVGSGRASVAGMSLAMEWAKRLHRVREARRAGRERAGHGTGNLAQ
ncbi:MAG: 4-hydroxythreonine-4-phosphate dehydrogenase [Gemmatimonadetes bacterium]|nr:4-hydroxythreonine-4-phosphate dehydrogenase [Gemmatimonadota bacterium]